MTTLDTRRSQTYRDDRAHVFHSWSAQGALNPLVVAGGEGAWFWDEDGNRYLDFSLAARQPQHRPPAPQAGRRHPGAGRPAVHDRPVPRQRRAQRGGPPHRRAGARRSRHGVLHQRRRRGHRERHAHGPPAHRPPQGARHLPQLPRRDRRRDHAHRRPAPLAERARLPGRRPLLGPVPVPLGRSTPRPRPRSASGRSQHLADVDHGRGSAHRSPPSSSRRSSAPTASSCRPTATSPACASSATATAS